MSQSEKTKKWRPSMAYIISEITAAIRLQFANPKLTLICCSN